MKLSNYIEVTEKAIMKLSHYSSLIMVCLFICCSTLTNAQKDKGPDIPLAEIYSLAPPINDLCENAIAISCNESIIGNTSEATTIGAPLATVCTAEVTTVGIWYSIIGNGGIISLTTCSPTTDYDTKIHVFSGNCGSLVCVIGNDDADPSCMSNSFASELSFISSYGTKYFIYISGFGSARGNFELTSSSISSCFSPDVPTLNQWGTLILLLVLLIVGTSVIRKLHSVHHMA